MGVAVSAGSHGVAAMTMPRGGGGGGDGCFVVMVVMVGMVGMVISESRLGLTIADDRAGGRITNQMARVGVQRDRVCVSDMSE